MVAKLIKNNLRLKSTAVILNLIDFYNPIRGNLRRPSRARINSSMDDTEKGDE